jgi:hypothetical protein
MDYSGFLPNNMGSSVPRMAGAALGLGASDVIKLDPRSLTIPEPSEKFKSRPGYSPAELPIVIDKEILNPGLIKAEGFGVS